MLLAFLPCCASSVVHVCVLAPGRLMIAVAAEQRAARERVCERCLQRRLQIGHLNNANGHRARRKHSGLPLRLLRRCLLRTAPSLAASVSFARGVGPDRKSKTFVNILRDKPCCVALVTALLAASALSMLRTLAPPNIIFEAVRFGKFAPRNKAEQVHLPVYTHTYIRVCRRAGALPSPVFFLARFQLLFS